MAAIPKKANTDRQTECEKNIEQVKLASVMEVS